MASHNQGLRVAWDRRVESFQRSFHLRREGLEKLVALVSKHLKARPDFLLDTGCGPGLVGAMLKKHRVLGVDFSHKMLLEAKKRVWSVVCADLYHLPFKHGWADAVTIFFVISDYIHANKKKILQETIKTLKPGGLMFLADYSPKDGLWQLRKQLHALLGEPEPRIHLENLDQLAEMLERLGVKIFDRQTTQTKVWVNPQKFFPQKFPHIPQKKVEEACQNLNINNPIVREFLFLAAKKDQT